MVQKTNLRKDVMENHLSCFTPVEDLLLPSERLGKRILLLLLLSFPVLWLGHMICLGLIYVIGSHFYISKYILGLLYFIGFTHSTTDVYIATSKYAKNRSTLLGYVYALSLAFTNISIWMITMEMVAPSLTLFVMIFLGLATGIQIERKMKRMSFSEEENEYFDRTISRSFAIEEAQTAIDLIEDGNFEQLQYLRSRSEERCCRIQIVYSRSSKKLIVNICIEECRDVQIGKFIFELPFTKSTTVFSKAIDKETVFRNSHLESHTVA